MREFEITTRVLESLDSVKEKLEKLGFVVAKNATLDDIYLCPDDTLLTQDNIPSVLEKSVLIRHFQGDFYGKYEDHKMITYKHKKFENGVTISEEKLSVNIDDIESANTLLCAMGYKELVKITNRYVVYKKDELELALQSVENLGLLIEYESEKPCDSMSIEEILREKKEMLEEIRALGIETTDEFDVKKAYELIKKGMED